MKRSGNRHKINQLKFNIVQFLNNKILSKKLKFKNYFNSSNKLRNKSNYLRKSQIFSLNSFLLLKKNKAVQMIIIVNFL